MSTIVAIKGTNGSGKSSVVRALIAHLGKVATLRFNSKEAGYRCKYGEQTLFVLGKYKSACGGLDSSFSYKGAADDVLICLDALAAKGHVVCEGVIAISSYGFDLGRVVWRLIGRAVRATVMQRALQVSRFFPVFSGCWTSA